MKAPARVSELWNGRILGFVSYARGSDSNSQRQGPSGSSTIAYAQPRQAPATILSLSVHVHVRQEYLFCVWTPSNFEGAQLAAAGSSTSTSRVEYLAVLWDPMAHLHRQQIKAAPSSLTDTSYMHTQLRNRWTDGGFIVRRIQTCSVGKVSWGGIYFPTRHRCSYFSKCIL